MEQAPEKGGSHEKEREKESFIVGRKKSDAGEKEAITNRNRSTGSQVLPKPSVDSQEKRRTTTKSSSATSLIGGQRVDGNSSTRSLSPFRKREQKILGDKRFETLRTSCNIPETEELVRVFDVAYRKPVKAHGALYIFTTRLCFNSRHNKSIKWSVSLPDVNNVEVKRGNHSPKTFLFLHIGSDASYVVHKFRGRTGRGKREMEATVYLTWEHAKGNKGVDISLLRSSNSYALKHPLMSHMGDGENAEDAEADDFDDDSDASTDSALASSEPNPSEAQEPGEVKEFWRLLGTPVLPPDQQGNMPDIFIEKAQPPRQQPDKEVSFSVSLERTWQVLFSDNSTFIMDFQLKNGAFDYHGEPWSNKQTHLERTCGFSKPVQSKLLSGNCTVVQAQRACFVNGKLWFYTETSMTGVPKGDCFTLRSVYEIARGDGEITTLKYWVWMDWHKGGGLLKAPITHSTVRATLESFDLQMAYVRSKIPTSDAALKESHSPLPTRKKDTSSATAPKTTTVTATVRTSGASTTTLAPKPQATQGGPLGLSPLDILLLGLVFVLMLMTMYYRWRASSLAQLVEELQSKVPL